MHFRDCERITQNFVLITYTHAFYVEMSKNCVNILGFSVSLRYLLYWEQRESNTTVFQKCIVWFIKFVDSIFQKCFILLIDKYLGNPLLSTG